MKPAFPGFPPEAVKFFKDLDKNNTREWFQPRKEHYEQYVKAPMEELVAAINLGMSKFAPDHVTDPKKAVFRIYRDTRFSSDKTPYKNHIAASFGRRGMEKMGAGGFYFSLNHKEIEVAGGVYHPDPAAMLTIRNHIAETHADFRRLLANRKLRTLMGELQGSGLSRVAKGFDPAHPAVDLLKKKDWIFFVMLDANLIGTPNLLPQILSRFEVVAPVIEYLNAPLRSRKTRSMAYQPLDRS